MEEAKTMGPDDINESRHSLPMGVGNNKRVDRKNKVSSDCSVNVFWDPSGGEMVERSWFFNQQTTIRKNRTIQIYCAGDTERNFEGAVFSNGFWSAMWSHMWCDNDQRVSTWKLWLFWAPAISFVKNCAWCEENIAFIIAFKEIMLELSRCSLLCSPKWKTVICWLSSHLLLF